MKNVVSLNTQKGFTAGELVITLLIIGILSAGVFLVSQGLFGQATSKVQADFEISCVNNMKRVYGNNPNYTGLSETEVAQGKLCPEAMVNAAGDGLVNQWGGTVTVAPLDATANVDKVSFETNDVDGGACSNYVSAIAMMARGVAVDGGSGYTWVKDYDAFDGTVINDLQEASMLAACSSGSTNTVSIKTYYR
jgi:prepilin-type N-terminal cleavage/methylation domain-containing protein